MPTCAGRGPGAMLAPMGFNPHRKYRRTAADYVMVGGAVVVCVLLLAWALLRLTGDACTGEPDGPVTVQRIQPYQATRPTSAPAATRTSRRAWATS